MANELLQKAIDKANNIFRENDCYVEIEPINMPNGVCIDIDGDWKHSHTYADYVMKECGFVKMREEVTFEDGSDWYQSIHYYYLPLRRSETNRRQALKC